MVRALHSFKVSKNLWKYFFKNVKNTSSKQSIFELQKRVSTQNNCLVKTRSTTLVLSKSVQWLPRNNDLKIRLGFFYFSKGCVIPSTYGVLVFTISKGQFIFISSCKKKCKIRNFRLDQGDFKQNQVFNRTGRFLERFGFWRRQIAFTFSGLQNEVNCRTLAKGVCALHSFKVSQKFDF